MSILFSVFLLLATTFASFTRGEKESKILCFNSDSVSERGVDVAIYDYADYVESMYGYTSKIIMPDVPSSHKGTALSKYMKRFVNNTAFYKTETVLVDGVEWPGMQGPAFPSECKKLGCDYVHLLKSGEKWTFPRYPEGFNTRYVSKHQHSSTLCY